jgi:hypothetical protein
MPVVLLGTYFPLSSTAIMSHPVLAIPSRTPAAQQARGSKECLISELRMLS